MNRCKIYLKQLYKQINKLKRKINKNINKKYSYIYMNTHNKELMKNKSIKKKLSQGLKE